MLIKGKPLTYNRARSACGISPLVGVAGFEPTASWSRTKRSTKLSHTPLFHFLSASHTYLFIIIHSRVKVKCKQEICCFRAEHFLTRSRTRSFDRIRKRFLPTFPMGFPSIFSPVFCKSLLFATAPHAFPPQQHRPYPLQE